MCMCVSWSGSIDRPTERLLLDINDDDFLAADKELWERWAGECCPIAIALSSLSAAVVVAVAAAVISP